MTGNMPGMPASTKATLELGSAPKVVDAPENSLAFVATCAWTSSPMTSSQSCDSPAMTRGFGVGIWVSSMGASGGIAARFRTGGRPGQARRDGCGIAQRVSRVPPGDGTLVRMGLHKKAKLLIARRSKSGLLPGS